MSLNALLITVTLNIPRVVDLKDFHPISLVGGIYKIIAKILANMLKLVLEKIISKSHHAFIRGRQILDPILIANECFDSRLRSGEPGVICKMDLEKAYNYANWDFLLYMLRMCGFGEKLCSWIAHCISQFWWTALHQVFSVAPVDCDKGIHCPLVVCPCDGGVGYKISAAMSGGSLFGFFVGDVGGYVFSHLLFVDDTLIFCDANPVHLCHMRCLFLFFEATSGLKINLAKS
jgi:hypothetical protein